MRKTVTFSPDTKAEAEISSERKRRPLSEEALADKTSNSEQHATEARQRATEEELAKTVAALEAFEAREKERPSGLTRSRSSFNLEELARGGEEPTKSK